MENEERSGVDWPAKATDECFPDIPVEGETRKKREGFEFVYADIVGSWYMAPETYVRMDGSDTKDIMPGHFGFLIRWGVKNYGFGEYSVRFGTDGKIEVQDECSGPEFSKALFTYLGQKVAEIGEHDQHREEKKKQEETERINEAGQPDVS
jgi:hypothetical protein